MATTRDEGPKRPWLSPRLWQRLLGRPASESGRLRHRVRGPADRAPAAPLPGLRGEVSFEGVREWARPSIDGGHSHSWLLPPGHNLPDTPAAPGADPTASLRSDSCHEGSRGPSARDVGRAVTGS